MPKVIPASCPDCGSELAPGLLACPGCARLLHGPDLKQIAAEAEDAEKAGDLSSALGAWRRALDLLPPDTRQHETILARIRELSGRVESDPPPAPKGAWKKGLAGAGALGLLLWKFKAVFAFVLTKGKFLLLGLTKASTFFSMILALGVYWSLWGWKFALGFIVCTYVHEMGHIWCLRKYGIKATAPMFIPGFGALVRLHQYPATVKEDARVGLAGPLWGLGACAAAYAVYLATDAPIWGAIARFDAWVNLFNLFPVWQLDGGRGFRSLTRGQRWIAAAAVAGVYLFSGDGLLLLLLVGAVGRAFGGEVPKERDPRGLLYYIFLVIALGALASIHVDVPGIPARESPLFGR